MKYFDWFPEAVLGLALGIFGWALRLSTRMQTNALHLKQHGIDIAKLEITVAAHALQLSSIEALREEFRSVAPDIKAMSVMLGKLDAILDATNRRLEIMEDRVFMQQSQTKH